MVKLGFESISYEDLNNSIFDEPEIKTIIFKILECITYLFEEVRKAKADYSFSPKSRGNLEDQRFSTLLVEGAKPTPNLSLTSSSAITSNGIRERMKSSKKKTPFLSVAKWAINDARALQEKLDRLKEYIDSLESISKLLIKANQRGEEESRQPEESAVNRTSTVESSRQSLPPPYTRRAPPVPSEEAQELLRAAAENHERALNTLHSRFSSQCQHTRFRRDPSRTNRVNRAHQCGHVCDIHPDQTWPPLPVPAPPPLSQASVEIFKSFRVSMEDPTYKVLPAALKKYNINASAEDYRLYIVYGDQERCLGRDEKPLVLFKQLDVGGKKPMFMLRKATSDSSISGNGSVVSTPNIKTLVTTHVKGHCWHVNSNGCGYRYEIRTYYSNGQSRKIWRTFSDFQTLHSEIEAEIKRLATELQAMPSLAAWQDLPKRVDSRRVVTSFDVEKLHWWLRGVIDRGLVGGIQEAMGRFLQARDGDESII